MPAQQARPLTCCAAVSQYFSYNAAFACTSLNIFVESWTMLNFLRNYNSFPQQLHHFTLPPAISSFSTSLPILFISYFLDNSHLRCEVVSHCGSDLHYPNTSEVELLFMCLLAIQTDALKKCLFESFNHF